MVQAVFNGMIAILMARFMLNDLPHAAGLLGNPNEEPPTPGQLRTLYITKEAQQAMLELVRRARSKRVEYQLELLLEDNRIYPGASKWGAPERARAFETGVGIFHTHPAGRRVKLAPKGAKKLWEEEIVERPAKLSDVDIIHILVHPRHRIIGVAGTETYLVRAVPYGLKETADVQFAARVKEYPNRQELLGMLPMVAELGVPVEGLEEYYRIYEFSLGPVAVPVEVLI